MKKDIPGNVNAAITNKTLITLMNGRITKKYALLGPIIQLMRVIGTKERKTGTTKNFKMKVVRYFVKKLEIRGLVGKRHTR